MIEKKVLKIWYFLHFRSDLEQDPDLEPDPLFHETDPRIQIWICTKMKWIQNTANQVLIPILMFLFIFLFHQRNIWNLGLEHCSFE